MRLLFLPEEKLLALKGNIRKNTNHYKQQASSWIEEYFQGENPFKDTKIEVEDFTLNTSKERPVDTDLDNIKTLYSKLSMLSEAQASDERLWAGLCHGPFWDYMLYRWPVKSENDIRNRYFFGYSKRRSLERNGLARLWWIGWTTYDEKREDPYELTRFILRDSDFIVNLLGRNFSSNKLLNRAVLRYFIEYETSNNTSVNRKMFRAVMEQINMLGGTLLIDLYNEDDYKKMAEKLVMKYCA